MNAPGEIAPLSKMVQPHAACVTTVGPVHIEAFSDGEAGVAREKAAIFQGLGPGGLAIVNGDNPWFDTLHQAALHVGARVATFGSETFHDARLIDFSPFDGGARVTAEIWGRTQTVVTSALNNTNLKAADIAALGITNQRETTIVWNRKTGQPYYNAIVWQDTRTDQIAAALDRDGRGDVIRRKAGLPPATYFSGGKLQWLLENVPGLREDAERLLPQVRGCPVVPVSGATGQDWWNPPTTLQEVIDARTDLENAVVQTTLSRRVQAAKTAFATVHPTVGVADYTSVSAAMTTPVGGYLERLDASTIATARSLGEDMSRARLIMRELLNEDGDAHHVDTAARLASGAV
jgi:hypothetical protein